MRKRACAVLSCESVEALVVKLWVYALLLAAARAAALPQRARAMCGARARGVASLRQLFSECGCFCVCARGGAQRCETTWQRPRPRVRRQDGEVCLSVGRCAVPKSSCFDSDGWVKSLAYEATGLTRGFSSKRHARVGGASLRVAEVPLLAVPRERGALAAPVRVRPRVSES